MKDIKSSADPVLFKDWAEISVYEFLVANPIKYDVDGLNKLCTFIEQLPVDKEDQSLAVH